MSHDNPRSILVIRPDAIGDVTLMLPLLSSLKKTYPEAKVTVFIQPYTRDLLKDHPDVDDLLIDPRKVETIKGIRGFFKVVSQIKSYRFDMVVFSYLDGYLASVMACARIPIRIGDGNKILIRALLTHPVNQPFRHILLHEVEQNLILLSHYYPESVLSYDMTLTCSDDLRSRARCILEANGWTGEPLIGIHPSTGGGNRAWLPEKYAALIEMIHTQTSYRVVLTGFGEKEKATIYRMIDTVSKKPILLIEKTTLEELKGVISLYTLIIGTDTGPTHMAAALGIPVLCISPTKFVKSLRWGPWQVPNKIVGNPSACDVVCNPYRCSLPTCLESISVNAAFQDMLELLKTVSEPVSIETLKSHWITRSLTMGFYIRTEADLAMLTPMIEKAKSEGMRITLLSRCHLKPEMVSSVVYEVSSLMSLFKTVIHHDINAICLPTVQSLFWTLFRQCTGPFMYTPAFVFSVKTFRQSSVIAWIKEEINRLFK